MYDAKTSAVAVEYIYHPLTSWGRIRGRGRENGAEEWKKGKRKGKRGGGENLLSLAVS